MSVASSPAVASHKVDKHLKITWHTCVLGEMARRFCAPRREKGSLAHAATCFTSLWPHIVGTAENWCPSPIQWCLCPYFSQSHLLCLPDSSGYSADFVTGTRTYIYT